MSYDLTEVEEEESPKWEIKVLKPLHKQVASFIAQGMKNTDIAALCGITPQYVSMLIKQPLVMAYISDMCAAAGTRLEALFEQSVDVIAETMQKGSESGKLKAARLQLEATKRIGRPDANARLDGVNVDRLERLADRLLSLQSTARIGRTFNENGVEIQEAEFHRPEL